MQDEEPLTGGNVTSGIVRIGDTVRRPATPATPAVHALLRHLEDVGCRAAPRSLGVDERGRHVLEFIPGKVMMPFEPADHGAASALVGRLLRELHDAAESFAPPAEAQWAVAIEPDRQDLVIHHDAAPWNLVAGPDRWVFIDWDGAGPGSRLWDLAYAAHGFVPLAPGVDPHVAGGRLRALADGYRLDEAGRHGLASVLVERIWSMHALLSDGHHRGVQPWATLWEQGHGQVWADHAEFAAQHLPDLRAALLA